MKADEDHQAMLARYELERNQKEAAIGNHLNAEQQLEQVSGEAAKMGHELLTVYHEYGDAQEQIKKQAGRIELLEKGAMADRITYEADLAAAKATAENMFRQFENASKRAAELEEANRMLAEERDTAVMARKYMEVEKKALEDRLSEVVAECEKLRAELIETQRDKAALAAENDSLKTRCEQDKLAIAHLTGDVQRLTKQNEQLSHDFHRVRGGLAACQDELEKSQFECNLLKEQCSMLSAKLAAEQTNLKNAQAQFATDVKGAQEMAGLAIVEKERALSELQMSQDELAQINFAASTAVERQWAEERAAREHHMSMRNSFRGSNSRLGP
eukprot:TRINITY_DN29888_c0_g1_i3.p1 TRINITY_DN29888_c0_g1~~TRINITY_DN29888_c0_g1_i3.p1  ORF type:complete len:330 (+),score=135.66 TRINITY_DN29888_c0_g1_i3:861-1850(+)